MQLTREERSGDEGDDRSLFELDEKLWDAVLHEVAGTTDLGSSAARRFAEAAPGPYQRCWALRATDPEGSTLGVARVDLPLVDNRELALISVAVLPGCRRQGVASALVDEALDLSRSHGRTVFQAFTWDRLGTRGPGALSARDGDGAIDPTAAGAAFLLNRGFMLAQVDVMSRLTLPAQGDLVASARESGQLPEEYALLQWRGQTPARWLPDIADLMVAMSTDIPIGEASYEAEAHDPARIRHQDSVLRRAGMDQLLTVALHRPSGRLVGFTRILHDPARAHVADQWDTLVVADHRGRGLGMAMKTRSHEALREAWPEVTTVVTGNASENGWMLDINRRLGFVPVAASGVFERREDAVGGVRGAL